MPKLLVCLRNAAALALPIWFVGCASSGPASPAGSPESASAGTYPRCVYTALPSVSRFQSQPYFEIMAGHRIKEAAPQAIAERMKAAADAGELYKALYFSRLLTEVQPQLSGAWTNRAVIAAKLGLTHEADLCNENAKNPQQLHLVAGQLLPGFTFSSRPVDLSDWAAALSLISDDVAATGWGLTAIKDSVSGIEVQPAERDDPESTPSAHAKPIRVEDVVPNLFVLRDARAMSEKSIGNGWALAGAILMATAAGMNANMGHAAAAADSTRLYGDLMGQAFSVDSTLKGGSYLQRTYASDRMADAPQTPRPSGKYSAVDMPLPLVWASGGSMSPIVAGRLINGGGNAAKIYAERQDSGKAKHDKYRIPDLSYVRLGRLCVGGACSTYSTAMELLLTRADVEALEGDPERRALALEQLVDFGAFEQTYRSKDSSLTLASLTSQLGYDDRGVCYSLAVEPMAWLAAPSGKTAGQ